MSDLAEQIREQYRGLHTEASHHPLMKSILDGSVSRKQYARHLSILVQVFAWLDPVVPDVALRRCPAAASDLIGAEFSPGGFKTRVLSKAALLGWVYVWYMAVLNGGRVLAKHVADRGWPTNVYAFDKDSILLQKGVREAINALPPEEHTDFKWSVGEAYVLSMSLMDDCMGAEEEP